MIFEFGSYRIDVDVSATAAFYAQAEPIGCDCPGCRNYEAWAGAWKNSPLKALGIAPEKPAEVYVNCANSDGTLFYGGFYHLRGRILQSGLKRTQISKKLQRIEACSFAELAPGFEVMFTEEVHLPEPGFPAPIIQMEISASLPWLLAEACEY